MYKLCISSARTFAREEHFAPELDPMRGFMYKLWCISSVWTFAQEEHFALELDPIRSAPMPTAVCTVVGCWDELAGWGKVQLLYLVRTRAPIENADTDVTIVIGIAKTSRAINEVENGNGGGQLCDATVLVVVGCESVTWLLYLSTRTRQNGDLQASMALIIDNADLIHGLFSSTYPPQTPSHGLSWEILMIFSMLMRNEGKSAITKSYYWVPRCS
nr:hypothetical protein Iba_chr07cCG5260 [Ipomoea batatas]